MLSSFNVRYPESACNKVDLPEPFKPKIAILSKGFISKSNFLKIQSVPNFFPAFSIAMLRFVDVFWL